jgi:hypothetical protein
VTISIPYWLFSKAENHSSGASAARSLLCPLLPTAVSLSTPASGAADSQALDGDGTSSSHMLLLVEQSSKDITEEEETLMNYEQRTRNAWVKCQHWITEYDGAASEAFLRGIPMGKVKPAIVALKEMFPDLRLQAIWNDNTDKAIIDKEHTIPFTMSEYIVYFQSGAIATFTVIYKLTIERDKVDISIMMDKRENGQFEGEVIWWSDQVFPAHTNHFERFQQIMGHFIMLQEMFDGSNLYLSPETLNKPYDIVHSWTEV